MDPVISVLIHAAAAAGNAALGEAGKRAIGSAWEAAVSTIKRRFGDDHPAPVLLNDLRAAAGNEVQTAEIQARLLPLHLGQDHEVAAAIERLAAAVGEQARGANVVNANVIKGAGMVFGSQTNNFSE
jgi:hypothetical protein